MRQTAVVYDTHAAVRRLTEAGISESQAEAMVREQTLLLEHNLATKTDIETLRQETRVDIEKLSLKTSAEIETLRQETRADIAAAKNSIIVWVIGLNMAMVGLLITGSKLL